MKINETFEECNAIALPRQLLRIMKLIVLIMTVCLLQVSALTKAQITLKTRSESLQKVLELISRQSGYDFVYSTEDLKQLKANNIDLNNASIETALKVCFSGQPLQYEIADKTVMVKRKETSFFENILARFQEIDVRGRVVDEKGQPLSGATVKVKGSKSATRTDENGLFSINGVDENAVLEISYLGYRVKTLSVARDLGNVRLEVLSSDLQEVDITFNTGYQNISKERATGSFNHINNELVSRSISTNILDRLKGVASGVLFDATAETKAGFNIRGRSTIFANTDPLVVLDNFPYDGDLESINPNDVEDITILKDAAAASIWGVRASNGVVVITTKKGKFNESTNVSFNSNVNIIKKPNINKRRDLNSSEIIDIEQFLYDKGYFDGTISSNYLDLSPVVEILVKQSNGDISDAEATNQLRSLRSQSLKNDLMKYYYRDQVNQQYALNINGGGRNNKYYLSLGYDNNLENFKNANNDRVTINANHTFTALKNKLEFNSGVNFTMSNSKAPAQILESTLLSPYQSLANSDGSLSSIKFFRDKWLDTAGKGSLLDWTYRPLDELNTTQSRSKLNNLVLNTSLKYNIFNGLSAQVLYQYNKGFGNSDQFYPLSSYYTRNLINQFSQVSPTNKSVIRPVPLGDIKQLNNSGYFSNNVRGNLNFNKGFDNDKHIVSAIAGIEVRDYSSRTNFNSLYGYNEDLGSISAIDYVNYYPFIWDQYSSQTIPGSPSEMSTYDRYVSYFGNVSYSYADRYTVSGSARKDESNIFGVKANQKGVPLWSVGGSWKISNESFFKINNWLPYLQLRATFGYNGNVDKTVSAYTTANTSLRNNGFGVLYSTLVNPPNPSLRWEKIGMVNLALDYGILKNKITGSFEYYSKTGKDIIGNSPLAPSTGTVLVKGNTADMKTHGFDVVINTQQITTPNFSWNTNFLLSHSKDKITKYKVNTAPLSFKEGYPYNALFSWQWAGLDPNNGDPLGYVKGQKSNAYGTIIAKDSVQYSIYNGSGQPTFYGSLRNSFKYRGLSMSFIIAYKLNYYFRARSINYTSLLTSFPTGHTDYRVRWQKSGDEMITSVPSMVYPADNNRDSFYANSEILVEKGDHIRLQDIQLSYDLNKSTLSKLPFSSIRFYAYSSNLGILWKANKKGIDPDYPEIPAPKTLAFGLQANF